MIIGEDEYLLIKRLREHKMAYQMDFEELKTLKSEVKYCEKLVEQSRHRLVQGRKVLLFQIRHTMFSLFSGHSDLK